MHQFDHHGWYTTDELPGRSTPIAPANTSTSTTPGAMRANFTGYAWVDLPYAAPLFDDPLPSLRAGTWESIKAIRDTKVQSGGYTVAGKWYHSDTFSRTQQLGLVMMGASIPAVQWKTMDGTFVTMTQTLAGQIFAAAAAQDQANFLWAETLRAQVNAATDPATVDITAGWPASYS